MNISALKWHNSLCKKLWFPGISWGTIFQNWFLNGTQCTGTYVTSLKNYIPLAQYFLYLRSFHWVSQVNISQYLDLGSTYSPQHGQYFQQVVIFLNVCKNPSQAVTCGVMGSNSQFWQTTVLSQYDPSC